GRAQPAWRAGDPDVGPARGGEGREGGAGGDPLAVPADADVVQLRGHLVASGACRDTPQDHGLVFRGDESLDRVFRGEQLVERNRGELRQVTIAGENA